MVDLLFLEGLSQGTSREQDSQEEMKHISLLYSKYYPHCGRGVAAGSVLFPTSLSRGLMCSLTAPRLPPLLSLAPLKPGSPRKPDLSH